MCPAVDSDLNLCSQELASRLNGHTTASAGASVLFTAFHGITYSLILRDYPTEFGATVASSDELRTRPVVRAERLPCQTRTFAARYFDVAALVCRIHGCADWGTVFGSPTIAFSAGTRGYSAGSDSSRRGTGRPVIFGPWSIRGAPVRRGVPP